MKSSLLPGRQLKNSELCRHSTYNIIHTGTAMGDDQSSPASRKLIGMRNARPIMVKIRVHGQSQHNLLIVSSTPISNSEYSSHRSLVRAYPR